MTLTLNRRRNRPPVVLICGARQYGKPWIIEEFIDNLPKGSIVVLRGNPGTDEVAEAAARRAGLHTAVIRKLNGDSRTVGPARNLAALRLCPDYVVAFPMPGVSGCKDMVNRAISEGFDTYLVNDKGVAQMVNAPKKPTPLVTG